MPFYPGPGVGGHCIPIDPYYFAWKAQEYECYAKFIELAGQVNDQMPEIVVRRIQDGLNDNCRSLKGARVLLLGVAYKKDIDDVRESPALRIIERLQKKGAEVLYHDPHVPLVETHEGVLLSTPFNAETLRSADAAVVVTDHSSIPYAEVLRHSALVVDTRNALRAFDDPKIVRL
jgi:UDP-N-acetyl-D-glucosamine dehydrogenase